MITQEEQEILIRAINKKSKIFVTDIMLLVEKYQVLTEQDLYILTDRKLSRQNFNCEYAYFKLVSNKDDLQILKYDTKGRARYYSQIYNLNGNNYVVSSQLYKDSPVHKDSKTPFYNWILDKFNITNTDVYIDEKEILDIDKKEILSEIEIFFYAHSFTYPSALITNLYLSLKSKPFVILGGVSGTGKSKLAQLFADAIGAKYLPVPVRPDWTDSTDLFGHLNLNGEFMIGKITDFIYEANENPDRPYILTLAEMNLARVEYYFSDVLSIMETRRKEAGKIVSNPFFSDTEFGLDTDAKDKYGHIYFSENLYIIGTVNMDETTFPFSKKVLDRANTLEMLDIDLKMGLEIDKTSTDEYETLNLPNDFLKSEYFSVAECYKEYPDQINTVVDLLTNTNTLLQKINAQIAYRVRDEISFYVSYSVKYSLLNVEEALDNALMQKVLPRIQGGGLMLEKVLSGLFQLCTSETGDILNKSGTQLSDTMFEKLKELSEESTKHSLIYPKSAVKIAFMTRRYDEDGYTSFWL